MARLTVRLPDSLRERLARQAKAEGVSMNQYLVYALTRASDLEPAAQQRSRFELLRSRFAPDEAEHALSSLLQSREEP